MKLRRRLCQLALGVGLILAGAGAGCIGGGLPMPKAHYDKKFIQQQYDTGAINYTEYCSMMKDLDANWVAPPPKTNSQYNVIQ